MQRHSREKGGKVQVVDWDDDYMGEEVGYCVVIVAKDNNYNGIPV